MPDGAGVHLPAESRLPARKHDPERQGAVDIPGGAGTR